MNAYLTKIYKKHKDKEKIVKNVLKEIENLNVKDQEFINEKVKIMQEYDNDIVKIMQKYNNKKDSTKIIMNLKKLQINILTLFLISKKNIIIDKDLLPTTF